MVTTTKSSLFFLLYNKHSEKYSDNPTNIECSKVCPCWCNMLSNWGCVYPRALIFRTLLHTNCRDELNLKDSDIHNVP